MFQYPWLTSLLEREQYPPIVSILPSQGMLYDPTHFFCTQQVAVSKKLFTYDEEWATEPLFMNSYQLNQLLERKLYFNDMPHVSIEDMLIADRDMILVNSLLTSYGDEFSGLPLNCQLCDKPLATDQLKIENLGIERLKLRPIQPHTNKFLYIDPITRSNIVFRFPTVKDGNVFEQLEKIHDIIPFEQWVKTVIVAYNEHTTPQTVYEAIKFCDYNEYIRFREYFTQYEPITRFITSKLICRFCDYDNTITSGIGFALLQLNSPARRKALTKEIHFLLTTFHLSYEEILRMPIDNKRRLLKRNQELIEEEAAKKNNQTQH